MKHPPSARPGTRTSSVEPLAFPKIDHSDQKADAVINMPTNSISSSANIPPLGQPDAQGFSTPGTLMDSESANQARPAAECGGLVSVISTAPKLENAAIVSVPTNMVIYAKPSDSANVGAPPSPKTSGVVSQEPRSQSAASNRSITSAYDICRICHCEGAAEQPLISPCCCSGSLKYVHQKCLQQWIKSSQTRSCEVCRFTFIMETKVKPFRKWEKLDISSVERRKILCSVTFHVVAITCVVWSLYVLIDRTAEEIRSNQLDWPFWTKLVVVAIGFTGGLVFMYVQCKMYVQLFRRWQSYNKVIYVQNGPAGGSTNAAASPGSGKYAASINGDGNGSALNK